MWSAAVSPAIRPQIIATLIPPPFVAITWPAASPTRRTFSLTVRPTGPSTGTYPPVPCGWGRPRWSRNLWNSESRRPRKCCHVPSPTFAHVPFGTVPHPLHIHSSPACIPTERAVTVASVPAQQVDHASIDLPHPFRVLHEIAQAVHHREHRPHPAALRDVLPALDRDPDL